MTEEPPAHRPPRRLSRRRRARQRLHRIHRGVRAQVATARRWNLILAAVAFVALAALPVTSMLASERGGATAVPASATAVARPAPISLGSGLAGVGGATSAPAASPDEAATPAAEARAVEPPSSSPASPSSPEPAVEGKRLPSGEASFYADRFEGRSTASGEPYRGGELTAAHRTLPFGSRLRVTNPENGKVVVVRINDRGPFHGRRVIDLSRTAASRLGLLERGRGQVELELLPS